MLPAAMLSGLIPPDLGPMFAGAAASAVAIGGPLLSGFILYRFKLARFMPLIRRSFEVIDPVLNQYVKAYGPSDVRFLIELVTRALADGTLTQEETRFVYEEIIKRYSPVKAAAANYRPMLEKTQEAAVIEAVKKQMELPLKERIYSMEDSIAAVRAEIQGRIG